MLYMYQSQYWDLDSVAEDDDQWSAEGFRKAVEYLETMPHADLVATAREIGLQFENDRLEDVDEEQVMGALLIDYAESELMPILESKRGTQEGARDSA